MHALYRVPTQHLYASVVVTCRALHLRSVGITLQALCSAAQLAALSSRPKRGAKVGHPPRDPDISAAVLASAIRGPPMKAKMGVDGTLPLSCPAQRKSHIPTSSRLAGFSIRIALWVITALLHLSECTSGLNCVY